MTQLLDPHELEELRQRIEGERAPSPVEEFSKYHDDPVALGRDLFGVELWSRQAELVLAGLVVCPHSPRWPVRDLVPDLPPGA